MPCPECELHYFAGIFDGEGSVSIGLHQGKSRMERYGYGQHSLQCHISHTSRELLESFEIAFGGHVYGPFTRSDRPLMKDVFTWSIRGKEAGLFLGRVRPYLRVKTGQAKLGVEFEETRVRMRVLSLEEIKRREGLRQRMLALNQHRGPKANLLIAEPKISKVEIPSVRGERNAKAKLTWEKVREIRRRFSAGGVSMKRLGDEFGVDKSQVAHILHGDQWKEDVPY